MSGQLTHIKRPTHLTASQFKGEVKYSTLTAENDDFPEISMLEDFLLGFVGDSKYLGTEECTAALGKMIYWGFEMLGHREIYLPKNTMKVVIAFQRYQEQQAVFSTYCNMNHFYDQLAQLISFNDFKQYGQLGAKLSGVLVANSSLFKCVKDGFNYIDGKDFRDAGECSGQLVSMILDI